MSHRGARPPSGCWRWARRVALGLSLLVLGIWTSAILLTERTADASPLALQSSVGMVDPAYTDSAAVARAQIVALMHERQIPGASVAVMIRGRLVWSEAFGLADRDRGLPATPTTQFRTGSVAKPLTAAAMMRLVEEGLLDLDAPVQRYVPTFPDKGGAITARLLASHRAGIRDYRDDVESINAVSYPTATDSLARFQDDPLLYPPGQGSRYSAYGYTLLSAAMEGAAGAPFPALMHRLVFAPLGMSRTVTESAGERIEAASVFYDNVTPFSPDGRIVQSPENDFSSKWAAGGFITTAEDLARFGAALATEGFLRDRSIDELQAPLSREGPIAYGLGWMIARDLRLRRACFHFGAGSGCTSLLTVFPEQEASIALLANLGHAKFPFGRLMGVINPFVPDPASWILPIAWIGWLATVAAIVLRRRLAQRIAAPEALRG